MRLILITFFLVALYSNTFSQKNNQTQEQTTFTLNNAIDYALDKSFVVTNSTLNKSMSVARKGEVRGWMLPQVNGGISYLHSFQVQSNIVESGVSKLVSG